MKKSKSTYFGKHLEPKDNPPDEIDGIVEYFIELFVLKETFFAPLFLLAARDFENNDSRFIEIVNTEGFKAFKLSKKHPLLLDEFDSEAAIIEGQSVATFINELMLFNKHDFAEKKATIFETMLLNCQHMFGRAGSMMLPREIAKFMSDFIPEGHSNKVYSPFGGLGSLAYYNSSISKFVSQEKNSRSHAVSQLRALINEKDFISCENGDSINNWNKGPFDVIISSPPFGVKVIEKEGTSERKIDIEDHLIKSSLASLNEGGRLIFLCPNSFLFSTTLKPLRQQIVEGGKLEYVISLPSRLLDNTGIAVNVVVISKTRHEKGVVLLDGENLSKDFSLKNTKLDLEKIRQVISQEDPDLVNRASSNEIKEQDFILTPKRYLETNPLLLNVVSRGSSLGTLLYPVGEKRDIEKDIPLVRIADLQNGDNIFEFKLDKVEHNPTADRATLVEGPALLCAFVGDKLKPTYLRSPDRAYITSNVSAFFCLNSTLDMEYLLIRLNSDEVVENLNSLRVGSAQRYLRKKDFYKCLIEYPELDEQLEIVKRFKDNLIQEHQTLIQKLQDDSEAQVKEQSRVLRHRIAGNLLNLREAVKSIVSIVNQLDGDVARNLLAMKDDPIDDETFADYLESMQINAHKATEVTNRAVNKMHPKDYPLSNMMIIPFLRDYVMEQSKINLGFDIILSIDQEVLETEDIHENSIKMEANEELFSDMLDQFIQNARQHGFEGNNSVPRHKVVIEIFFDSEPLSCTMNIGNTGNPLPPGFTLDMYVREGAMKGPKGNTGFGGYYINQIIKRFDGELAIVYDEHGADGIGGELTTSFEIDFPLIPIEQ
jgi:type I restriction enzyme M protein